MAALLMLAASAYVSAQTQARPIPRGSNTLVGRVLDLDSDAPIAGAVITLVGYFDAEGRPPQEMPASPFFHPLATAPRAVMTTDDGRFLFRDLPAGRYTLSASAFGCVVETSLRPVEIVNRDTPTDVTLRAWKTGARFPTASDGTRNCASEAPSAGRVRITTPA